MGTTIKTSQMYVNGQWVNSIDGETIDVVNPATGELITTVPSAKAADVDRAAIGARETFDGGAWWPRMNERQRGRILLRAAEIVRRDAEQLAHLETLDCGKPIRESRSDIDEVAFIFEYYGGWATKIYGEVPPVGPDALSFVLREPMGVAGAITPWNYPMLMAAQKVAPGLAAGCTIILKPAEQSPMTALEIPKILEEAGLPVGVLHVVTGMGETAGAALVSSPLVDKISFTGSGEVGKTIMRGGADTVKRVTLELGGKSPNIVFADADFDAAVEGTASGVFGNQGEVCSAGSRVLVERPLYDAMLSALVMRAEAVRLGDGLDEDTTMGPLISKEQEERVSRYIKIGADEARLGVGGARPTDPRLANGYFVPSGHFRDVTISRRSREEIFGPVMSVIPFSGIEEAVRLANDSAYGLAAAIWTSDSKRGLNTARALRAGVIWINASQLAPSEAPWGSYKQSGLGHELGRQGLDEYQETKHVYINLAR